MTTPNEQPEQKAAELAEKVAKEVEEYPNCNPDNECYETCERAWIERVDRVKNIILRELNLAELVKCKERCEELERELVQWNKDAALCGDSLLKATDENTALRAKVQELEKDKERLDWLENSGLNCPLFRESEHHQWELSTTSVPGDTIRDAIDNAKK